jgi:hypothetical protein
MVVHGLAKACLRAGVAMGWGGRCVGLPCAGLTTEKAGHGMV